MLLPRLVFVLALLPGWGVTAATESGSPAPAGPAAAALPRIEHRLPWHGRGEWLQGDLHTHYLTDRKHGLRIAHHAQRSRLDFVASTEHAEDVALDRTTPALAALRERFPGLIFLAGLEWNMPGAGHAGLVVEPGSVEVELLVDFAKRFDRKVNRTLRRQDPDVDHQTWGTLDQSAAGLDWLGRQDAVSAVLLHHPGKDSRLDTEDWRRMRRAGLAGFEAAPGHQRQRDPGGDYTVNRHEPMMTAGGDYDRLLADGGALAITAGSDFHSLNTSYYPGAFSRTLVYAPERSGAGIVRAVRAGATATVLGNIASAVETRAATPELKDYAQIGETLVVPVGAAITYSVIARFLPAGSEAARPGRHEVEFVSNFAGETRVESRQVGQGLVTVDFALPPEATRQPGSFFVRARGRRQIGGKGNDADNADLLFHVGATWVRVEAAAR